MPGRRPISPWRRRLFRFWVPFRVLRAHPRLFGGVAAGFLAEIFLPETFRLSTRLLIDWNVGTWFYFIATGLMIARASPESIRRRAKTTDEGKVFILVLDQRCGDRGDRGDRRAARRREGFIRVASRAAYWARGGDDHQRLVLHSSDLRPPLCA